MILVIDEIIKVFEIKFEKKEETNRCSLPIQLGPGLKAALVEA